MTDFMWGVILLLIGASLIIKSIFGVSLPIMRFIPGAILIYIGIQCITSQSFNSWDNKHTILFSRNHVQKIVKPEPKYNTILSQSIIDLSDIETPSSPTQVDINVILSDSTLIINPEIPTQITLNTALGQTNIPHEIFTWTGNNTYSTAQNNLQPLLIINANVVLSNFNIKNK